MFLKMFRRRRRKKTILVSRREFKTKPWQRAQLSVKRNRFLNDGWSCWESFWKLPGLATNVISDLGSHWPAGIWHICCPFWALFFSSAQLCLYGGWPFVERSLSALWHFIYAHLSCGYLDLHLIGERGGTERYSAMTDIGEKQHQSFRLHGGLRTLWVRRAAWPWTGLPTSLFFCLLPVQGNTVVSTLEDCHENQINKDLMVLAVFSAWPRSLKKLSRQLEPPDLLPSMESS